MNNNTFRIGYNDRGELICEDIFLTDSTHAMINNEIVGEVKDNKLYIDNRYIGTIVRSKDGVVVLNDVALEKFRAHQKEQSERRLRLRRFKTTLLVTGVIAILTVSGLITKHIINKISERDKEKAETLAKSQDTIEKHFAYVAAVYPNFTDEERKMLLTPIKDIPVEDMDMYLKYKAKILYAELKGYDYSEASRMAVDPHNEKSEGEWVGSITLPNEYGIRDEIGHTSSDPQLGRDIIRYIIDASHIDPSVANEEKCKESYTNRLANIITNLEEVKDLTDTVSKSSTKN